MVYGYKLSFVCFHDPDSVFTYDGCVASGVFPERDDWTSGRIFISDQLSAVFLISLRYNIGRGNFECFENGLYAAPGKI